MNHPAENLIVEDEMIIAQDLQHRLSEMEARLKAALRDKEILLQELYHRVKNNLSIVASLLELHSTLVKDERARAALWESESLGLQLVNILAQQLGGTIELGASHGTAVTIRFQEPHYAHRI
jgi:two-component sensor histidine kinase